MILRSLAILLWLVLAAGGARAQVKTGASASPPALSVCEILSKRLRYDGQIVRVRDRTVGTSEGFWLKGYECPGIVTTDGYVWDSLISIARPGYPLQIHHVDFEFDEESEHRLLPKYRELLRRIPKECIQWTYTGMFETRRDWTWTSLKTPRGFGHLGRAPGEIIIKSADGVAASPNCTGPSARP
jgi:hypothetical protein